MDGPKLKLIKFPIKDRLLERINGVIGEVECWICEEDDEAVRALYHHLINARAIYSEYFALEEYDQDAPVLNIVKNKDESES